MFKELFLPFVVAALQVVRIAALKVAISPDRVRVGDGPETVSYICTADSALVGCEYSWWDWNNKAGPLLDLSRGPQSQADPANLNRWLTGYNYTGRGLEAGECGVSMQVNGFKRWMVACRVRAETGGWKYAWADLYAHGGDHYPLEWMTPKEAVVLPGGEARLLLKTQEPMGRCWFWLQSVYDPLDFSQGAESPDSTGRYRYRGAGLQSGECGLTLSNISRADNGPIMVHTQPPGWFIDQRLMALIVAHPPPVPTISLVYTGTNLTATCIVGNSRPVANISWILGDKVIRQGESLDDTWRWPWMEGSNLQTLELQLKPEDHEKVLKCVVSHVALVQPHEARAIILITGSTTTTTSRTQPAQPL